MSRLLTDGDGSANPAPSRHDPAFAQQGQVDWVALSKVSIPMTVATLKRLSGAGVQEITHVGAVQLGTRFNLADIGYQRVYEAIERADFASAFGNVAYFGFGYRSYMRFLADSLSGTKFIALCASLSEAHSEEVAARVISCLWTVVGYPEDYQPSLPQFRCLVKACAGVLAPTTFGETVGIMLGPHRERERTSTFIEASDPMEIARALHGLFEISKGVRTRITIVGRADCGFIAAIAYWLFDFKIYVQDSHGRDMFISAQTGDEAQVHIMYRENQQISSMIVSQSTFVLNEPRDLLRYLPDSTLRSIRSRVPWSHCLTSTFGKAFVKLRALPAALGGVLGGAARIYKALANSEKEVGPFSREAFCNYVEDSYGHGLMDNIGKHLPELGGSELLTVMQNTLSQTVENAITTLREAFLLLERECGCQHCSAPSLNSSGNDEFCLIRFMSGILCLVTVITSLNSKTELMPTEIGLVHIYNDYRELGYAGEFATKTDSRPSNEALAALLRLTLHGRPSTVEEIELSNVMCIFTGYRWEASNVARLKESAVANHGICAYKDCLESMTLRPEISRRIHVIPGHISWNNRVYGSVSEQERLEIPSFENATLKAAGNPTEMQLDSIGPEKLEMTAVVEESIEPSQLFFYYKISTSKGQALIPPNAISRLVLESSGLVNCSRGYCGDCTGLNAYHVISGWDIDYDTVGWLPKSKRAAYEEVVDQQVDNPIVLSWKCRSTEISRLLALELQRQHPERFSSSINFIMSQDACLPCCVRFADQEQRQMAEEYQRKHGHEPPLRRFSHIL